MLSIPYVPAPENACALACYTMVAKHFFPETTFEEITKISDWQPKYVVWAFKFWLWIMDKGISVTDYDLIGYETWANEGFEALKRQLPEKEFNFYKNNSKDIESHTGDIRKVLAHSNFTFHQKKPTFENLKSAFESGAVCEVVLDLRTLNQKTGFALHRVVILDVADDYLIIHDPDDKPDRKVEKTLFLKSWLEAVGEPELCLYRKV